MNDQLPIVDLQQVADYAWAAGIVDGEGSISRNKKNRWFQFQLYISQSGNNGIPEMLTRFNDIFKVGHIYGPHMRKEYLPRYAYYANDSYARKILRLIWPYLGTVKREQAYKAGFKLNTWE